MVHASTHPAAQRTHTTPQPTSGTAHWIACLCSTSPTSVYGVRGRQQNKMKKVTITTIMTIMMIMMVFFSKAQKGSIGGAPHQFVAPSTCWACTGKQQQPFESNCAHRTMKEKRHQFSAPIISTVQDSTEVFSDPKDEESEINGSINNDNKHI